MPRFPAVAQLPSSTQGGIFVGSCQPHPIPRQLFPFRNYPSRQDVWEVQYKDSPPNAAAKTVGGRRCEMLDGVYYSL